MVIPVVARVVRVGSTVVAVTNLRGSVPVVGRAVVVCLHSTAVIVCKVIPVHIVPGTVIQLYSVVSVVLYRVVVYHAVVTIHVHAIYRVVLDEIALHGAVEPYQLDAVGVMIQRVARYVDELWVFCG